jgi:MFS transporter, DHA1 family, inner membrane transport protein
MKATNENDVNAIPAVQKDRLPAALWALALCLFAFGTNESVVPGLLLKIASDLKVSTSSAGLLVSG